MQPGQLAKLVAGFYLVLLPWMFPRPPFLGKTIAADFAFPLLAILLLAPICRQILRNSPLFMRPFALACCAYAAAFALAALFSPTPWPSLAKCARVAYLASLGICFAHLASQPGASRFLERCWFAGLALALAYTALGILSWATDGPDVFSRALSNYFGSLPPGPYRRPVGPFRNFNMFATYLTMSSLLLLPKLASSRKRTRTVAYSLLAAATLLLAATLSPAIGAFLCGLSIYLARAPSRLSPRLRQGLAAACAIGSVAILCSTAISPRGLMDGGRLQPSPRLLTWRAAAAAWLSSPKSIGVGFGPGQSPIQVVYVAASGQTQKLADPHQIWLSVATQTGCLGLLGLLCLLATSFRALRFRESTTLPRKRETVAMAAALVSLWGYAGLSGSFEDARHFWILLGWAVALPSTRLPATSNPAKPIFCFLPPIPHPTSSSRPAPIRLKWLHLPVFHAMETFCASFPRYGKLFSTPWKTDGDQGSRTPRR